jgi:hypothetical protein
VFLFEKAQTVRLQSMRTTSFRSTGIAAALGAVAMSCSVASAQMGEMQGMHHHHAPDGEKLGSVSFPVSCAASKVSMERGVALYYAAMLKNTGDGAHSSRPSLAHAKAFVAGKVVAGN